MKTEISKTEPTIVMTRVYRAPRELVWAATTEPAHIVRWWGGPWFTSPVCEIDLRPGGRWHHVMRFPDGMVMTLDSVFEAVEPPARLVWRGLPDERGPGPLFTSTLEERGRETLCTLVIRFATMADRDAAVGYGFTGPIEGSQGRLDAYLDEMQQEV